MISYLFDFFILMKIFFELLSLIKENYFEIACHQFLSLYNYSIFINQLKIFLFFIIRVIYLLFVIAIIIIAIIFYFLIRTFQLYSSFYLI